MNKQIGSLVFVLLFLSSFGLADEPSYYLIGNSLTWDTVPSKLDGDVQWHVDCGKSLPYIFENPDEPCVKSSTLWPTALKDKQYSLISVQSHYGATLTEDVATISKWVDLQPQAVFVIHTGWPKHEFRVDEWSSKDSTGKMQHSLAYINQLLKSLREKFPERQFRRTHCMDLVNQVAEDIAKESAPFENVEDLYRDAIHMKVDTTRYLMHNAMRHALGQPRSNVGWEELDPNLKKYFDGLLDELPADSKMSFRPEVKTYIEEQVLPHIDAIPSERKAVLDQAVEAIREQSSAGGSVNLTFICTHNSRRSQFGQVWADVAARWCGIDQVQSYSGGTETTACNPRTVAALQRLGFDLKSNGSLENPTYRVNFGLESDGLDLSSKLYNCDANPKENFIALMCCSDASEKCPVVAGAIGRIPLHYVDPKVFDGTDREEKAYDERCLQISQEMFYVMTQLASE